MEGQGKSTNFKSELNNILMLIFKRPVAKADLVFSVLPGPPDVARLTVPVLDITLEQTHPVSLNAATKKTAEVSLAGDVIAELVRRIDAEELTLPQAPLPQVTGDEVATDAERKDGEFMPAGPVSQPVRTDDFKSPLNTALQKLLGREVKKEDRTFMVDTRNLVGRLDLPGLVPPFSVECAIDMEGLGNLSTMTPTERQAVKNSVEHQLAEQALTQLVDSGHLVIDTTKPFVHQWQLGSEGEVSLQASLAGMAAEAIIGEAQASVAVEGPRHVPPRGAAKPPGVDLALLTMRRLQETWTTSPPEEYSESFVCRPEGPGGGPHWFATLTLMSMETTGGAQVQGHGDGPRQQSAKEMAAESLFAQLPDLAKSLPPPPHGVKRPYPDDGLPMGPVSSGKGYGYGKAKGNGKGWGAPMYGGPYGRGGGKKGGKW
ncbi:unnamed protein product [Polarella glacialis]|uniref:Uncharacterized protein n=1 Tax=Polarella glacialis TaxID=89957 RepID=A0A813E1D9_POLGL|nr:unnamed protein product [Polarella glacialis]